ncbi:MAG TPA: alpha-glucan family phosphorylase [Candidatus Saccharimonadales bacterium]|nr:alpha-glucan family phosphorylase [Candidatus Saccharimonadales bacterium]
MSAERLIAYFSMEIALLPEVPTYSGGLGVLAGDTLRAAADLNVPMVGVTLLHRKGYFYQRLDAHGWQSEEPVEWVVEDHLEELPQRVSVKIEGRTVRVRAWRFRVRGAGERSIPVYLLDTDLPENSDWDRTLTHWLYGGDQHYRLCQEMVLGVGGVRMLRALGHDDIDRFHMNEGHAAFLTVELLDEQMRSSGREQLSPDELDKVRRQCVFTTHTPVAAGHDQFDTEMVKNVLGRDLCKQDGVFCHEGVFNMTYLALNLSHYVNGVAKRHGEVSRHMFSAYAIDAITNGIHAATWTAPPFQALYDRHIPGWRQDNYTLRYALSIPGEEIWKAHREAKARLIQYVNRETNLGMDVDVLTLGFARRVAPYKRGDLFLTDLDRLKRMKQLVGPIQVVYAGKAHPFDGEGKAIIARICDARDRLRPDVKVAFMSNYDMELARRMVAGVDIWLNTPRPPLEASGTSGMKAAVNGIPSLSVLDGWWIEGCIEGVTGWSIGQDGRSLDSAEDPSPRDAEDLYQKLEKVILPTYYRERDRYIDVMRHAIALNGSFFNTHRMIQQYVLNAYYR